MGYYLQFDGVDDLATVPHYQGFNLTNNFSIKVKVKILSTFSSLGNGWKVVMAKDSWTAGQGWALFIDKQASTNTIAFYKAGSGSASISSLFNFVVDTFYSIEVVADGTNLYLKVDGTTLTSAAIPTFVDSTVQLYLGARHGNGGTDSTDRFQGVVDDASITVGGVLNGEWSFNEGSGTTSADSSGFGNNVTLTNGVSWVNDGVGAGTPYTKSLSDSVITSESFSKQFSATVIDSIATGEGESERTTKAFSDAVLSVDSLAYTQGKAVSLADSIAISEAISKALTKWQTDGISTGDSESEATSRRLSDAITQTDVITAFGGKSVILTEGITVSDSVAKAVARSRSDGLGLAESLGKQLSVRLYDVIISTDGVSTYLPNVPEYREVIRIPLNIYTKQTVLISITQRQSITLKL